MKLRGGARLKTIRDVRLHGQTVLLRADYNVPVQHGHITDDYRMQQSLPTIEYLLKHDCKVVICSHLGRPTGPDDKSTSLMPVAKHLAELLKRPVAFASDCIGPAAEHAVAQLAPGHVLLLENLRYHPEEEANDRQFAKQLAKLAQLFVQDGFGVVHRAHASTEAITHELPSVAGLLLDKEVTTLTHVMENPERPLMAVVGGAKIADKMEVLTRFIELADFVAIGGAMANTFLRAEGIDIGKSLTDASEIPLAKDIMDQARRKAQRQRFIFYLP